MRVKMVEVNTLEPHPKNPRVHPGSAIEKLMQSIKEYGWTNPILLSQEGFILSGHARVKAAKRVGVKKVPVISLPLRGAKAEAYMIADNRLQEETFWDIDTLKEIIREITSQGMDAAATGFSTAEVEALLSEVSAPDTIEGNDEKESEPRICPYCGYEF